MLQCEKIGLIDNDLLSFPHKAIPNLPLMKISSYYKGKGYDTKLILEQIDLLSNRFKYIFSTKVFSHSKDFFPYTNCVRGGTAFNNKMLPERVEQIKPDYSIYDEWKGLMYEENKKYKEKYFNDYSMGFLTRGCFRKCYFCVNSKYDRAFFANNPTKIYSEGREKLLLLDDNFLAYRHANKLLIELKDFGKKVKFLQGLDIRLLVGTRIKQLLSLKYDGDYIFAFDFMKDREIIIKRLRSLRDHTTRNIKLYVFCAFSPSQKDLIEMFLRCKWIMELKSYPFIMKHKNYKNSSMRGIYDTISRYFNMPNMFKSMTLKDFCYYQDSDYKRMIYIKKNHPELYKWFTYQFWK